MKTHVRSELHLEFADWRPPPCNEDIAVLAGDIGEGQSRYHLGVRHGG